jgi:SAM-dependent methyltransferase
MSNQPCPDSYDRIAELYDEDIGPNASDGDVDFYVRACRNGPGPVLELGCGTGRITLPLVQAGAVVWGIDASLPMLRVLKRKAAAELSTEQQARLHLCCQDMRRAAFATRFAYIFCAHSTFSYLVDEADQLAVLHMVHAHLAPAGRFLLDMFVPDPVIMGLPDNAVIHDYRRLRADGSILERNKTIAKNVVPGVNITTRYYRLLNRDGVQTGAFTTTDRIRYFYPEDLERLFCRAGFEVVDVKGGFSGAPLGPRSRSAVFVCRPMNG